MGELKTGGQLTGERLREFIRHLLNDLRALQTMIDGDMIESGVRRIGAEQEMFLVNDGWRPANCAMKVLDRVKDPHFTTELAKFNLEVNLDPLLLEAGALTKMEKDLCALLDKGREAALHHGAHIVLSGMLPTIRKSDLTLDSMTPFERYRILNRATKQMRGGPYHLRIKGIDELHVRHDNVMVEACNCSFQVHFQVGAEEFPNLYNVAQVAAAPILAAATNSPILFGRRLWSETRIAIFQQAVDTRRTSAHLRERSQRVDFGRSWIRESVLELFEDDIARFRVIFGTQEDEDPHECLRSGKVPRLDALRLHNGTVYRWNRACYGITGGKPHLRIENRVLPAGPTPRDEVANAAFWLGLIGGLSFEYPNIASKFDFDKAKGNFHLAARYGLATQFEWLDGSTIPAHDLILKRLLPLAHEGLQAKGLDEAEIATYLGTIAARVASRRTGSWWILNSLRRMQGKGGIGEALGAVTAAMVARQKEGEPVSKWEPASLSEAGGWKHSFRTVDQYMTTDIYTVEEDEPLDLVLHIMNCQSVRHVPVEDAKGRLVGLVSYRRILKILARDDARKILGSPVSDVMLRDPVVVGSDTQTLEAIQTMREHRIGCLPITKNRQLVGIVTERDFMDLSRVLISEQLSNDNKKRENSSQGDRAG